jgi:hypothetical protein
MNRQRAIAAGFFSLVILGVLMVLILTYVSNSASSSPVYILTQPVKAGQPVQAAQLQQVHIHADSDQVKAEERPLAELDLHFRYSANLQAGDILRGDDLVGFQGSAQVQVTFGAAPPLAPGDYVDVYRIAGDGSALLFAQQIPVVAGSGVTVTLMVPSNKEPQWVAITSGGEKLVAAKVDGTSQLGHDPVKSCIAVANLAGLPAASVCGTGTAATP